ncbi:MAG TPA: hypothetical protein VHM94_11245 [Acidimicrobiia bacterium]|nr:hypothetical protein [Acidimicrobiia bacterium]
MSQPMLVERDHLRRTPSTPAATARHHVSAILAKLGVRTRGEAAAAARRLGVPREWGVLPIDTADVVPYVRAGAGNR